MDTRRWQHFTAMALIGDGMMAIVRPHRDAQAWNVGPKPWRGMMRFMGRASDASPGALEWRRWRQESYGQPGKKENSGEEETAVRQGMNAPASTRGGRRRRVLVIDC